MEVRLGRYQHYKGDIMQVVGKALHSETMEEFVVYRHVTGSHASEGYYWVRPAKMFYENVAVDGVSVPRFKYIE